MSDALGKRPGHDQFVADIFVNLALLHRDCAGEVGNEAIDESMEVDLAQPFRDRRGVFHIDDEKGSPFDAWSKVAASDEAQQYVLTKQPVQIEQEVDDETY